MMAGNGSSLHEEYLNTWSHPYLASIAIRKHYLSLEDIKLLESRKLFKMLCMQF